VRTGRNDGSTQIEFSAVPVGVPTKARLPGRDGDGLDLVIGQALAELAWSDRAAMDVEDARVRVCRSGTMQSRRRRAP
jgi:hypothetical protein